MRIILPASGFRRVRMVCLVPLESIDRLGPGGAERANTRSVSTPGSVGCV